MIIADTAGTSLFTQYIARARIDSPFYIINYLFASVYTLAADLLRSLVVPVSVLIFRLHTSPLHRTNVLSVGKALSKQAILPGAKLIQNKRETSIYSSVAINSAE